MKTVYKFATVLMLLAASYTTSYSQLCHTQWCQPGSTQIAFDTSMQNRNFSGNVCISGQHFDGHNGLSNATFACDTLGFQQLWVESEVELKSGNVLHTNKVNLEWLKINGFASIYNHYSEPLTIVNLMQSPQGDNGITTMFVRPGEKVYVNTIIRGDGTAKLVDSFYSAGQDVTPYFHVRNCGQTTLALRPIIKPSQFIRTVKYPFIAVHSITGQKFDYTRNPLTMSELKAKLPPSMYFYVVTVRGSLPEKVTTY